MSKNRFVLSEQRLKRISDVVSHRQSGFTIVLEDVHDPHNAAAVLRSCDAFGVQKVHFVFTHQEAYDPARVGKQSSSSAHKWLDFEINQSITDCYNSLRKENYDIWATILSEDSTDLYKADLTSENIALVFGNEHAGLTKEAVEQADHKLYLPMKGMVESLNISVTVGVCLFEVSRQRLVSGKDYSLSESQREELTASFKGR